MIFEIIYHLRMNCEQGNANGRPVAYQPVFYYLFLIFTVVCQVTPWFRDSTMLNTLYIYIYMAVMLNLLSKHYIRFNIA